ncbi:MAG: tRNA lysidine(34) synthetase TilS [Candidatus Nephthysia bennettiae]|uniref:tRNA(Ile)-lysidine synthase n=1 Tax=Candidatus Nephthysia bennettiae TaxID=3127016 RepID=A0A934K8E9_9BACT|nr:tRNA lysidine(34) synthetase TilS [Candidatus Dormibacteraeota bacterium]PZR86192.1 MAG: tRNA lysidine(34) synthetase TilS [Candidatus Dormibacteraeota bacterium]
MSVIPAEGGLEGATRLLPTGARLLAAVSGGPDSSALLVWLAEGGRDVAAAHFDHVLRTGSEQDAEHVARLCRRLGVELFSGRREQALPRGSVQAAARTLRYEFMEEALRRSGRDLVLLGHTADDVVEGAVIHLLRGSGLAGARGMPGRRGPFLRPFLGVWRAELAAFLRSREVESLDDPANRDIRRFLRARVRHELLPQLELDSPGFKRRLWAATRSVARLQAQLEAQAAELGGERAALRAADRAVRMEAYRQLYGNQPALDRRQLESMDELTLRGRTGSGLDLPRGLRFRVGRERVEIVEARPPERSPATLHSRPCSGCPDPSAVHLRAGLRLRLGHRSPGLRMRPVGSPGRRKLQDILTDARVPRHLRDGLPLVFAEGRLAWVPGIALDADAAALPGEPAQHVWLEGPTGMVGVPDAGLDAYHSS